MKAAALNVVQKILKKHLVEGNPATDSEIGIHIDQTLTQDATGTMAYLQFESMDVPRVKTDISVSYVDHNTVQIGFENADDHDFLASIAKKYGIVYSKEVSSSASGSSAIPETTRSGQKARKRCWMICTSARLTWPMRFSSSMWAVTSAAAPGARLSMRRITGRP